MTSLYKIPVESRLLALLCVFIGLMGSATAQAPQAGLHYFAAENLRTGIVERRGTTGAAGVAFNNLVLRPNSRYRLWILQARTLKIAKQTITTPGNGELLQLQPFRLQLGNPQDSDNDGLPNVAEFILGTNPRVPDSDSDGLLDGAEVLGGTDPLDGQATRTGILFSVDTPGQARDVSAFNNLVAIADGSQGVSVFNVFSRMNPEIVARVATTNASRVALAGTRVAVADRQGGLKIINFSDPPAAAVENMIPAPFLRGSAISVAASVNLVFVGTDSGQLVLADLVTGAFIDRVSLNGAVVDIGLSGDHVYAITDQGRFYTLPFQAGRLQIASTLDVSSSSISTDYRRLFVGRNFAYATQIGGFDVFDISNPVMPTLSVSRNLTQNGWQKVVSTGSGVGIAAAGTTLGAASLFQFDINDPASALVLATPGQASSVALFNGLSYVADTDNGLQVLNTFDADVAGVPPTVSMTTNFGFTQIEEGQLGRITAIASDDVQIRNVEFFVDGQVVAVDGNFPYEYRFIAPRRSQQQRLRLRVRASDVGGNTTFSSEVTVDIMADQAAPTVTNTTPLNGALLSQAQLFSISFSEAINPATLVNALTVIEAGPDGQLNTADDVNVPLNAPSFQSEILTAFYPTTQILGVGLYQATLSQTVTDIAGNTLAQNSTWSFRLFGTGGGVDSDNDGLADSVEALLGTDPNNPDSDGDGTFDGDEDQDTDGLSNRDEVALGTDPNNMDTDNDGLNDGMEDPDFDRLTNVQEIALQTNPLRADTDGDQFSDKDEVDAQTDPRDPNKIPVGFAVTSVSVHNVAPPTPEVRTAFTAVSVRNTESPEAVSKKTVSAVVSVNNTGNP